ncbi:hypothetical protein BDN72DRAFT_158346 [Pluteus cervinus]|uniref:Uncharacterized protein n=1 Tax=Pluteus cervinus TaxID=181527 RepID=A0ACD3AL16_9AGAR|nr:hypothetical protein BDN72DRAFT_158346 [Pluteus cervinus]
MSTLRLSSQSWHGLLNRISVISTATTPPEYHVTDPAAPSEYDDSRSVASLPRYSVIEPFETYVDSEVALSTPIMPSLPRRAEEISDRRRDTPAFGGRDAQTQHIFNIEGDNKAKPWAVLKLYSSASSSSASPHIYGDGEVSGSVTLSLDSPQTVNLIEIILRGRIIKGNLQEETFKFLEHTLPVWSKASGHPHHPTTGPSQDLMDGSLETLFGHFLSHFLQR